MLVQVVPSSLQIHVPEELGTTHHHRPSWVHTFDCGFSPVLAVIDSAVSGVLTGGSAAAGDAAAASASAATSTKRKVHLQRPIGRAIAADAGPRARVSSRDGGAERYFKCSPDQ